MFCRACVARSLRAAGVRAAGLSSSKNGAAGTESPLKKLLDESSAFGEADPTEPDLQWATQPYASLPPGKEQRREQVDPRETTVLLFPGQGAQYVGMGLKLKDVPTARALYDRASEILGFDLWRVCTEGPEEKLERHTQPATLVTALAALERVRDERPGSLQQARAAAGFSLGEIAALVFAGSLQLEQAVRLAELRETAMRAAASSKPGAMLTVWLAPAASLGELLARAKAAATEAGVADPVCVVANYLYPQCRVLAGDEAAVSWVEKHGRSLGVRRAARLRVAGAFHSPLMEAARAPLREALRLLAPETPKITVLSCTEVRPYRSGSHVARGLERLTVRPVKWEQLLHVLFARPKDVAEPRVLALGPGTALRATLKHVNARAWDTSLQIEV